MEDGNNPAAVSFASRLVQLYLVDERHNAWLRDADLRHTTDTLARAAALAHAAGLPPAAPLAPHASHAPHAPHAPPASLAPPDLGAHLGPAAHMHAALALARVSAEFLMGFEQEITET